MNRLILGLAILLSTTMARAEDVATENNTSTVKASEVGAKSQDRKDIDEEITNARLRAQTGAKSKFSFASSFSYAGAALTNPTSTERPQLNDGQASADPAKLSGQMSIKYRVTDHDNLNVGFGIDYTPSYVVDKKTGAKEAARTNASSPYISYSRVFKAGDVQHVLDASLSKYTAREDVEDHKLNSEVGLSHTMMMSLGSSKAEFGVASSLSYELYSEYTPGKSDEDTAYQIQIAPIFEYAISDKMSFRTVARWLTWTISNGDRERGYLAGQTQSMGLGYAVTRDVYLYPNMQWRWSSLNADKTTVGMTAYINL